MVRTKELYYESAYTEEFDATVTSCIKGDKGSFFVSLDRTAFFPKQGGQSCDRGFITDEQGNSHEVRYVSIEDGVVTHEIGAELHPGSKVRGRIDMALMDYSTNNSTESQQVRDNNQWNIAQKDSVWQSMFIDWVVKHPKEYIAQMPQKLVNTYLSDNVNMCTFIPDKREKEYMYEEVSISTLIHNFPHFSGVQWLALLNLLYYYALLLTALCSLYYFDKQTCLLPLCIIVLGTLLLLFVGHGEARFHIPFMPFVIILSSMFIYQRYGKKAMG